MSIGLIFMILAIVIFAVLPSLKTRTVRVQKLLIAPIIFLYLFYNSISENFHVITSGYFYLCAGFTSGILMGVFLCRNTIVAINKANQEIQLPGTYLNLFVFCSIFVVHFVIGYLQAVQPESLTQPTLQNILLFTLAFFSSTMLGSNLCLFYKYRAAK